MNTTATQRPHLTFPRAWMTVALVAVAVALIALVLVDRPVTQTSRPVAVVAPASAVDAVAVPLPESQAFRRQLAAELATTTTQAGQFTFPRNHVVGVTLDAAPSGVTAAIAGGHRIPMMAPNDPYPFNHFAGSP